MAPTPLRVFLSYTAELAEFPAGRTFAAAAAEAVRAAGAEPVEPVPGDRWRHFDTADLVVLVVGFRSGLDGSGGGRRTVGELDLDRAARAGLPHFEVLLGEDVVGPARVFRDPGPPGLQEDFRARLTDRPTASTPDGLFDAVFAVVERHQRAHGHARQRVLRRLPPAPNVPVVGREDLLDLLWAHRGSGPSVLTGPPGHGKSTVAATYVHQHLDHYDVVWWIPCSVPDAIPLELADLARALGSPHDDVPTAVEDLRSLLRGRRSRCLLVLDDLSDSRLVQHVLDSTAEVLITTNVPVLHSRASHYGVHRLDRADSVRLLRYTTRLTETQAHHVASELRGSPIALSAVATALRYFVDYDWYVTESPMTGISKAPSDLPVEGRLATRLLVRALRRDEQSFHLLSLAAWLGGERVPITVLGWELEIGSKRVTPHRPLALDLGWLSFYFGGLGALGVLGLADDGTITLHPALAEELRSAGEDVGGVDAWTSAAAQVLLSEVENKPTTGGDGLGWAHLIRQALAIHGRISRLRSVDGPVLALLRAAAFHLDEVGMGDLASRILKDVSASERTGRSVVQNAALGVIQASANGMHLSLGVDPLSEAVQRVGTMRGEGDLEGAVRAQRDVVRICDERYGEDSERALRAEIELAVLLREAGRHTEARSLLEPLAKRTAGMLGKDDLARLTVLTELAATLHSAGQHQRATALGRRVVEASERVLGSSHPRTLAAKVDLAADHLDQGDHDAARALAEDALERSRRVLGPDHPDTLNAASTLAAVLAATGDVTTAHELDRETFERYRRTLGHDDPATLLAANNLAGALRLLGRPDQARDLDLDTVERLRRVLGPEHPDTRRVAENLALDEELLHAVERNLFDQPRSHRAAVRPDEDG